MISAVLVASDDTHRARYGSIELHATRTIEGGVTLSIWAGNVPVAAFSYGPDDLPAARTRYATIRDLGLANINPHRIADALVAVDAAESIIRAAEAVTA